MSSDLEVLITELEAKKTDELEALEARILKLEQGQVQGAQHRLHSTRWYKDVKKLEDIVNRDRQKTLLEVWYDEKPEIVKLRSLLIKQIKLSV
ncbi:hypothetical protein RhiirB3_432678 [Rhizophagus irregularis]|nr:hypothetical protein RhiirB3_432678 [Rhizophagus irregularis]